MLPVIKVENISKQYRLGNIGTGTINHDVNRWWHRVRGKEDPYLKIGEENNRTTKGSSDYVWALKDINFEVMPGEVLGIIGRNGAGKSTLLKILSRTTAPTTGRVRIHGRVASLLEVGTGFHPELSGRENVYLNGAILGMTKAEINRKFDEIVDFAGVERYIDTPVKRYSSGMYVRLAFGVAAHLEPEILIVDEVLAVGDAEFQKKCLGKMKDVSDKEGRTVLFVSHNMAAVAMLCQRAVLLNHGTIQHIDKTKVILDQYNYSIQKNKKTEIVINKDGKKAWFKNISLYNGLNDSNIIVPSCPLKLELTVEAKCDLSKVNFGFGINSANGSRLFTLFSKSFLKSYDLVAGVSTISCVIDNLPLKPDEYFIEIYMGSDHEQLDYYDEGLFFTVNTPANATNFYPSSNQGSIFLNQTWA